MLRIFGCMVASWGGYRLARGWHYAKLSLSSAPRLSFSDPCVCVCVFFPSILDIKFVGRTSRGHTGGRSHRIFNPPSFCGACLDFCREKDSAIFLSLVDREVEFCVLTN